MPIVTTHYRPKRTPRKKRKQPAVPAIVEYRPKRTSVFGAAPYPTEEELRRRGDLAEALWHELVRRATGGGDV